MTRSVLLLPALAFSLSAVLCSAAEPNADQPKQVAAYSKESNKAIGKLIQALASSNMAPKITGPKDGEQRASILNGYEGASQRKVLKAWQSLLDAGVKAFPALVEHANDHRYSCTLADPDGDCNASVGDVCQRILRNQIDGPCYKLTRDYGPNTIQHRAAMQSGFYEDLPKWWRERQNSTLAELQVESAGAALEVLKAEIQHTDGRERAQLLETVRELDSLIRQIKASGRPIRPTGIEGRYERMTGLPGESSDPGSYGRPHPYKRMGERANNK
jgi:hypothetical protein